MPYSFVFIGRSGCGKGTQAELLDKKLFSKNEPVLRIETGKEFRAFIEDNGHVNKLSKEAYERSDLQPSFLACFLWGNRLVKDFTGKEHVIFDGVARTLDEVMVLDTALFFLEFSKKIIVHLDVSEDWSYERLRGRGRSDDDTDDEIAKRMEWFTTDVMPAIEYYSSNPSYVYLKINGEQTIEEVHADVMKSVKKHIE